MVVSTWGDACTSAVEEGPTASEQGVCRGKRGLGDTQATCSNTGSSFSLLALVCLVPHSGLSRPQQLRQLSAWLLILRDWGGSPVLVLLC